MNFLPFELVLYKILMHMNRKDLIKLIGLKSLRDPTNINKLNKFWDEIEIELRWNQC